MTKSCETANTCRRRHEVRWSLALFAMANYLLGMVSFMFLLCSSSPEHIKHLSLMLTDFPAFVEEMKNDSENSHNPTAH